MENYTPERPTVPPWMEEIDAEIMKLVNSAPPITPKPFEDSSEFIENHSNTFKLFRNQYVCPAFLGQKGKTNLKNLTQDLLQPSQPQRRTSRYFVPLPKNKSRFSIQDMNDLYAVYSATPSQHATNAQILKYSSLVATIKEENNEYSQHIRKRWIEESKSRVDVIQDYVTAYVALWWEARIDRVNNYPEMYSKMSPLSLSPSDIEGQLVFIRNLVKIGTPPKYFSSVQTSTAHPLCVVQKELIKQEQKRIKKNKSAYSQAPKEVSDDKVAVQFAIDHQVQIVATPGVLTAILANTPGTFEESWCIPFQIKEFSQGDVKRKIIFMNKKLPPKALTLSEKNAIFAKAAVRRIYSKSKTSLTSLELESEELDDEMDTSNFLEDEDKFLESPSKKSTEKEVSYDLWEYKMTGEQSVLSKNHRKPFKILLRTTTKGMNFDSQRRLLPCVMTCKLDYQPEYGAAALTFNEMMRDWISLHLRPDSILHRVRVDPVKGDTIMVECKTATAVYNECLRLYNRCAKKQVSIIQSVYDHLSQLPPGNYLLTHEPKDKGFMYVYHEQQDKQKRSLTNYYIHEVYNRIDTTSHIEQSAACPNIDPQVLTPTLHSKKWIPCVFPPISETRKKLMQAEMSEKKQKLKCKESKKKKKKKKKKSGVNAEVSLNQQQEAAGANTSNRNVVTYDNMF